MVGIVIPVCESRNGIFPLDEVSGRKFVVGVFGSAAGDRRWLGQLDAECDIPGNTFLCYAVYS